MFIDVLINVFCDIDVGPSVTLSPWPILLAYLVISLDFDYTLWIIVLQAQNMCHPQPLTFWLSLLITCLLLFVVYQYFTFGGACCILNKQCNS
jgi:hypothetical protein